MNGARTIAMLLAVGVFLSLAGAASAATTTMTATANGPNGSHDDWNNPGNWTSGVPSGAVDAVVSAGLYAEAWNNSTPSYDGPLTLQNNSTLQMGWTTNYPNSLNALGNSSVTMNSGTEIRLRLPFNLNLPPISLAGAGQVHLSPSTSAHHKTRNFNGALTGAGDLTVVGNNNNTAHMNLANPGWSGGFIANADDGWRVEANVSGCFGLGDVTMNERGAGDRGVTLQIDANDVIADTATLYLNGSKDNRKASKLILNASDTVADFWVDGVQIAPGTYDSSSGLLDKWGNPLITGAAVLTVQPPEGYLHIYKFLDADGDGVWDQGEEELPPGSFEFEIFDAAGAPVGTFPNCEEITLEPGLYTGQELLSGDWRATSANPFDFEIVGGELTEIQFGNRVPEPATLGLLSLAACGLGGYVRKRRKA